MSKEIPYFMKIIVKLIIFMNFCDYKICLWGAWCRLCACNLTLAKRLIYYTLGIECAIELFVTMFSAMRLSLGVFNIQSALQSHNIYGNSVLSHFSTFNAWQLIHTQDPELKLAMKSHLVAPWSYLFVHAVLQ